MSCFSTTVLVHTCCSIQLSLPFTLRSIFIWTLQALLLRSQEWCDQKSSYHNIPLLFYPITLTKPLQVALHLERLPFSIGCLDSLPAQATGLLQHHLHHHPNSTNLSDTQECQSTMLDRLPSQLFLCLHSGSE